MDTGVYLVRVYVHLTLLCILTGRSTDQSVDREVNHYINTLSHKDFPWLGHGTDFFLRFLNQDCSKNYRYLRFSHYAHVILHIENLRKKHHEGNQLFKKKGPDKLLLPCIWSPVVPRLMVRDSYKLLKVAKKSSILKLISYQQAYEIKNVALICPLLTKTVRCWVFRVNKTNP